MDELLSELMNRLELIGDRDESLYDSEVREAMGAPVFFLFIKPEPGYLTPDEYGMSDDDNRLIKAALLEYIERASNLSSAIGLKTFHQRLAAFQNGEIRSQGKNYFDDFFGWMNPAHFDEDGKVIPQTR